MKREALQRIITFFTFASLFLFSSYGYAKQKESGRSPVATIRAIKLTTDCERSVLSMLASDVALSRIARELGLAFPMDKVRRKLQILTGELILPGGFSLKERASVRGRTITRMIIQYYLRELGLEPELEVFNEGANVLVEIPGSEFPDEILEVGAHFDAESEYSPAADDNGSGLSLALQMVEYFLDAKPKRTIRFVFYDLEESGAKGSKFHVEQIKNDPRLFLGAIIVDMIGYLPEKAEDFIAVAEIGEEPKAGATDAQNRWRECLHQLAQAMYFQYGRYQAGRRLILSPERDTAKPGTGDHGSYWDALLPAIFIAAPYEGDYINPKNHTGKDDIESMRWDYYVEVSRFVVEAVAWIAGATVGPQTVDPLQTGDAREDLLLEAGANLIPAERAPREPALIATRPTWSSLSSYPSTPARSTIPEYDVTLLEEMENRWNFSLSSIDRENLVRLWELNTGFPVLVVNDLRDKGLLLFPGDRQWLLRDRRIISFVLHEIRSVGGMMATTGTVDPLFLGTRGKTEIRDIARRGRIGIGANSEPISGNGFKFFHEVPFRDLNPMFIVSGKSYRERHLEMKNRVNEEWDANGQE